MKRQFETHLKIKLHRKSICMGSQYGNWNYWLQNEANQAIGQHAWRINWVQILLYVYIIYIKQWEIIWRFLTGKVCLKPLLLCPQFISCCLRDHIDIALSLLGPKQNDQNRQLNQSISISCEKSIKFKLSPFLHCIYIYIYSVLKDVIWTINWDLTSRWGLDRIRRA